MNKKLSKYLPDLKESWDLALFMIIGGSILSGAFALFLGFLFPSLKGWLTFITYPLIFIPPYFWIRRPFKRAELVEKTVPINSPNFGKLGAFLSFFLILILIFAFNIVTEPLSSWMETPDFIKELLNQVTDNKLSSFITLVIMAPLLEEMFCRGIILRGLLEHTSPLKAILWSAAIFGIIHLNPWQAIPAFLVGSLMGWIYWKTRCIWATIFIHFINNGFAYFLTVFYPELPDNVSFHDILPGNSYYLVYLISLAYLAGTLTIMNKSYGKSISY